MASFFKALIILVCILIAILIIVILTFISFLASEKDKETNYNAPKIEQVEKPNAETVHPFKVRVPDYNSKQSEETNISAKTAETAKVEAQQIPSSPPVTNVDFSLYKKRLNKKIMENWNPPPRESVSRRVKTKLWINKEGGLDAYQIIEHSGNAQVDEAAIEAIKSAAPFEALPPEFTGEGVQLDFVINYRGTESNP